jgi:hypothetical protein
MQLINMSHNMLPYHINKYPLFIVFNCSSSSQCVPLEVPNNTSVHLNCFSPLFFFLAQRKKIAPQFYPILFGHSLTFMYMASKKGAKGKNDYDSILGEGSISRLLCLGSSQCSRNICDEQMNVAPS